MPIDINEYATPTWIKYRERYPWVEERNYNYANLTINPRTPATRYNGADDGTGWKAAGYNPNHNSTRVERVIITRNVETLKPY
jgi:hypothetical protein